MKITFRDINLNFDSLDNRNTNRESFQKVSDAVREIETIGSGTCGGHHGTDHPYEEYRVDDTYIIRIVRPGVLQYGWLELDYRPVELEQAVQNEAEAMDAAIEAAQREWERVK